MSKNNNTVNAGGGGGGILKKTQQYLAAATAHQHVHSCMFKLVGNDVSLVEDKAQAHSHQRKHKKQLTTVSINLESPIRQQQFASPRRLEPKAVLDRWQRDRHRWGSESPHKGIESYLAQKSAQFKKYRYNIFILQRSALRIQHWFFKALKAKKGTSLSHSSHQLLMVSEHTPLPLTMQEKERESLRKMVATKIGESPNQPMTNHSKKGSASRNAGQRCLQQSATRGDSSVSVIKGTTSAQDMNLSKDPTLVQLYRALETVQMRGSLSAIQIEKFNNLGQGIEEQSYSRSMRSSVISGFDKDLKRLKPSKEISNALNIRDGENKAKLVFDSFLREREYMSRRSKGGGRSQDSFTMGQSPSLIHKVQAVETINEHHEEQLLNTIDRRPALRTSISPVQRKLLSPVRVISSNSKESSLSRHVRTKEQFDIPIAISQILHKSRQNSMSSNHQNSISNGSQSLNRAATQLESLQQQKSKINESKIQSISRTPNLQTSVSGPNEKAIKISPLLLVKQTEPQRHIASTTRADQRMTIYPQQISDFREAIAITNRSQEKNIFPQNYSFNREEPSFLKERTPSPLTRSPVPTLQMKKPSKNHVEKAQTERNSSQVKTSIGKSLKEYMQKKMQAAPQPYRRQQSPEVTMSGSNPFQHTTMSFSAINPPEESLSNDLHNQLKTSFLSRFTGIAKILPSEKFSPQRSHTSISPSPPPQKPQLTVRQPVIIRNAVKKLVEYKRLDRPAASLAVDPPLIIREKPRLIAPQPESKPSLISSREELKQTPVFSQQQLSSKPLRQERSSVFQILKKHKSYDKLEPISIISTTNNIRDQEYQKLKSIMKQDSFRAKVLHKAKSPSEVSIQPTSSRMTYEEYKVVQHHKQMQKKLTRNSVSGSTSYIKSVMNNYLQSKPMGAKPTTDITPVKKQVEFSSGKKQSTQSKKHNFNPSLAKAAHLKANQLSASLHSSLFNINESSVIIGRQTLLATSTLRTANQSPSLERSGGIGHHHQSTDSIRGKRRDKYLKQDKSITELSLSQEREAILIDAMQKSVVVNNSLQS